VALPEVDVSLTIPAHNESENIGRVLKDVMTVLAEGGRTYEIVLVDDGSQDDTVGAARDAMGEDARNLTVVTHKQQRGYARTVCDGLRASRGKVPRSWTATASSLRTTSASCSPPSIMRTWWPGFATVAPIPGTDPS
jgi:hypothetical protein